MTTLSAVTLKDIVESTLALNELAGMPLRPVVAFRIAKTIKFVQGEVADFDAARIKMHDQFGSKDETGKLLIVDDRIVMGDKTAAFEIAYKALLDDSIELPPSVKKVKISEFDSPLKPAMLISLFWLIDDSETDATHKQR